MRPLGRKKLGSNLSVRQKRSPKAPRELSRETTHPDLRRDARPWYRQLDLPELSQKVPVVAAVAPIGQLPARHLLQPLIKPFLHSPFENLDQGVAAERAVVLAHRV